MSDGSSFRTARVSFTYTTEYHEGSGKRNMWLSSFKDIETVQSIQTPSSMRNSAGPFRTNELASNAGRPFRRVRSEETLRSLKWTPITVVGPPPRGVYKAYRSYTKHLMDATGAPSEVVDRDAVFKRARSAAVDMEILHSRQQGKMTLENYAKWVDSFPPLCGLQHPLHSREYIEDVAMHAAKAIHHARSLLAPRFSTPQ